jgi:lipoprotein-anchoring transpeptidase ErfK/SrfK
MRSGPAHIATLATLAVLAALPAIGCKGGDAAPSAATIASAQIEGAINSVPISRSARLAAIAMSSVVYDQPSFDGKKIGYLRLGAIVPRSDKPAGTQGCPGGWYGVAPRGFVCVGKTATLTVDDPLVKAASLRPDTKKPLPYAYGFVLAVAPLYLRLPSKDEQLQTEFHVENHLRWWDRKGRFANKGAIGANDKAHELFADAPVQPPSDTLGDGILLGGKTDADPPPFWLASGQRDIPNVSGFDVLRLKPWFANRARRHTGVAFIGAFQAGPEWDNRRFAITVDMRMLPIDKVKPETGSPFHGVDLKDGITLPVAFARPCNPNAKGTPRPCVPTFRSDDGKLKKADVLPTRAFLELTSKESEGKKGRYLETKSGTWVRAKDVGVAAAPSSWPAAAERGDKWIDVSIEQQTLVLWEGKKPVFATLVSTGQDGLGDPKTTKSTPLGIFRIKSKHITTTMDSNERSDEAGKKPDLSESPTEDDKEAGHFELRDVPYVQYFHEGYAIHAAYWHDHFGLARSHGCVNLAPIDAMRVFRFTDQPVPDGWHGINVDAGKGTVVVIHK